MLECPRCHRANPVEAEFCYFDGAELRAAATPEGKSRTRLPQEFVFPSGRRCQTYDELARACLEEWEVARGLLADGLLAQFLAASGRIDLAQKARPQPDADAALDAFVRALPARSLRGPRLELQPRRLAVGRVPAGEARQVTLAVANAGLGLLQGDITAFGGGWLGLAGADDGVRLPLRLLRRQTVTVRIETGGLPALRSYPGKLTLITNGGIVEVPVSLEVEPRPFPHAPFQGVDRPRALAERMRENPKAAVPLLEAGKVAAWFAANGWDYPVEGPPARGIGAVQQFFEAMGLARAPAVTLASEKLELHTVLPQGCRGQVSVHTPARKWVYATAEADVPWIQLPTPAVSGPQRADLPFDVDAGRLAPGIHQGRIRVRVNGGRTLETLVSVTAERAREPLTRRLLRPALVGALAALVLRLFLAGPGDLYARVLARILAPESAHAPSAGSPADWILSLFVDVRTDEDVPAGSLTSWLQSPLADVGFVRHFALAMGWLGAAATAFSLWRRGVRGSNLGFAAMAGTIAALAASASLACLLVLLDGLPRILLSRLAECGAERLLPEAAWLWTPAWILTAAICWALLGAAVGFGLGAAGPLGQAMLGRLERLLSPLMRWCGLERLVPAPS